MTDQELKDIEARCEKAVETITVSRKTHIEWADFMSKCPSSAKSEKYKHVGDANYHAKAIAEYDNVLSVLSTDIRALIESQLQAEQWISADQEPEIYDQFEVYATLNGEWKIKDATFSFEFERFIFDGCQEWIPMFYRKVELPNQ